MDSQQEMHLRWAYHDAMDRWRAMLADLHSNYHDPTISVEQCQHHRCYEYAWTLSRHGRISRPDRRRT